MTRRFLGLGLAVALVWAVACSNADKKETPTDGGCDEDRGCPMPTNKICMENSACSQPTNSCAGCPEPFSKCQRITTATSGTCTKPCASNVDCPSNHACQEGSSIGLLPSCIATCSDGIGCPVQHSCITNSEGLSICVPSAWNTP